MLPPILLYPKNAQFVFSLHSVPIHSIVHASDSKRPDLYMYIYVCVCVCVFRFSDGPVVWGPPATAVVAIDLNRVWSLLQTVSSTRRTTTLMLGDSLSTVKPRHERP